MSDAGNFLGLPSTGIDGEVIKTWELEMGRVCMDKLSVAAVIHVMIWFSSNSAGEGGSSGICLEGVSDFIFNVSDTTRAINLSRCDSSLSASFHKTFSSVFSTIDSTIDVVWIPWVFSRPSRNGCPLSDLIKLVFPAETFPTTMIFNLEADEVPSVNALLKAAMAFSPRAMTSYGKRLEDTTMIYKKNSSNSDLRSDGIFMEAYLPKGLTQYN